MPILKAVATLKTGDGIAANYVQNTFHFLVDSSNSDNWEIIRFHLQSFYNDTQTSQVGTTLASFYSDGILRGADAADLNIYPTGAPPNDPVFQGAIDFDPAGTVNQVELPSEVALVLSYRNEDVTAAADRWRRGRVYTGPFHLGADNDSETDSRPSVALRTVLLESAANLRDNVLDESQGSVIWVVYSKVAAAIPGGQFGLGSFPVTQVRVDNAWDTQRRRGTEATLAVSDPPGWGV